MSREYPEYDDWDYDRLVGEHDRLLTDEVMIEPDSHRKLVYVHKLLEKLDQQRQAETSFIDSNDGKTVKIITKSGRTVETPPADFVDLSTYQEIESYE